ncbi:ATP-dependent (S)-NAD(P)H-hydrate dehydratase [Capsicum annuum]|nr:ATP-dependent (S)-NAD(P)H-hydrate dehydratase [Capsicum annuum]KAF3646631.1 ATP-dependent (S)-NAD(P)H-hydrate dehydratase [Capsicum annuum]
MKHARECNVPMVIDGDGLYLVTNCLDLVSGYPLAVLTPNLNEYKRLVQKVLNSEVNDENGTDQLLSLAKGIGGVTILRKGKSDFVSDGKTGQQPFHNLLAYACCVEKGDDGEPTEFREEMNPGTNLSFNVGSLLDLFMEDGARRAPFTVLYLLRIMACAVSVYGSPRRCGGQGDILSGSVAVFLSWARQCADKGEVSMNPTILGCVAGSALLRKAASMAFDNKKRSTLTGDIIECLGRRKYVQSRRNLEEGFRGITTLSPQLKKQLLAKGEMDTSELPYKFSISIHHIIRKDDVSRRRVLDFCRTELSSITETGSETETVGGNHLINISRNWTGGVQPVTPDERVSVPYHGATSHWNWTIGNLHGGTTRIYRIATLFATWKFGAMGHYCEAPLQIDNFHLSWLRDALMACSNDTLSH